MFWDKLTHPVHATAECGVRGSWKRQAQGWRSSHSLWTSVLIKLHQSLLSSICLKGITNMKQSIHCLYANSHTCISTCQKCCWDLLFRNLLFILLLDWMPLLDMLGVEFPRVRSASGQRVNMNEINEMNKCKPSGSLFKWQSLIYKCLKYHSGVNYHLEPRI